jgi:hypothetical protein
VRVIKHPMISRDVALFFFMAISFFQVYGLGVFAIDGKGEWWNCNSNKCKLTLGFFYKTFALQTGTILVFEEDVRSEMCDVRSNSGI